MRTSRGRGSRRPFAIAVAIVICVALAAVYVVQTRADVSRAAAPSATSARSRLETIMAGPHILFRNSKLGADYRRLEVVPRSDPGGPRTRTPLTCDRIDMAGGIGVCGTIHIGAFSNYEAEIFDSHFKVLRKFPLQGTANRVRVAPDGKWASITVFVYGDSYAATNFSTRAEFIETHTGEDVGNLEAFTVTQKGTIVGTINRNYWGVTFARGGPSAHAAARAVARYRAYAEAQAKLLVARTAELVHAIQAGNVALAKTLYTPARTPYERIEPVAKSMADPYLKINARATDITSGHWNGFHRLERALFKEGDVTAMGPTATQLLADVTALAARVKTVRMEPATIANGAIELLNEVTTVKLTGSEDVDAHTDLSDAAANVEGAQAAFDAIAPLLPKQGAHTATPVDDRLRAILTALAPLRSGTGYVPVEQLTPTQTRTLVQAVDAAAERLSLAPKALVG